MVLKLTEYIAKKLIDANPYLDAFAVNCIKIKSGEVVNFIGSEKTDFRPSDLSGNAGYIRINPNINYSEAIKKNSSCQTKMTAEINFKIVVFSINQVKMLHPVKLENKISTDLLKLNWSNYAGIEDEIKLLIQSSNLYDRDNFKSEIADYDVPAESTIIAVNCTLSWNFKKDKCSYDECDVFQ